MSDLDSTLTSQDGETMVWSSTQTVTIYDPTSTHLQFNQSSHLWSSAQADTINDLTSSLFNQSSHIWYSILYNSTTTLFNTSFNSRKTSPVQEYSFVWLYISPVIFLLGLLGNALTILIMRRKRMRGNTTSVYLSLLAVADSAALITRIPTEFFKACRLFVFSDLSRWTCKLEKFLFYTSSDIAIWLLVAFSIDRLIAVTWPLLKKRLCRPRRALLICLFIALIFALKNIHVFWTRDIEYHPITKEVKRICGRPNPYRDFEEYVRPWIAFTTISLIPFILISISNTIIITRLINRRVTHPPQQRILCRLNSSPADDNSINRLAYKRPATQTAKKHRFTQTALMCIGASVCFLLCVTPSIVLIVGRVYWTSSPSSVGPYGIAKAVNYQLSCLNHAINFFLYCLTGERFRREMMLMLCSAGKSSRGSLARQSSQRKFSDAPSSAASKEGRLTPFVQPFIMRDSPSYSPSP